MAEPFKDLQLTEVGGAYLDFTDNADSFKKQKPENLCQPCLNEGNIANGHSFCVECNEYLCMACIRAHNRFSTTKSHHLSEYKSQMKFNKSVNAGTCLYHTDKYLDQFCVQHDEFCCISCSHTRHRSCKPKLDVNEMSIKVTDEGLSDIKERKERCLTKIQEVKEACTNSIDMLVVKREDAIHFLGTIQSDLFAAFNSLQQNHTEAIERKYKEIRGKLEADLKTCNEMENSLKDGDIPLQYKEKSMQFIKMKMLLREISVIEETANAINGDVEAEHFNLMRSSVCLTILKQPNVLVDFADNVRIYKETGTANILHTVTLDADDGFYKSVYKQPSDLIVPLQKSILVFDTMKNMSQIINCPDIVSSVESVEKTFFAALPNRGQVIYPTENTKTQLVLQTNEPCIGIVKSSNDFYVTVVSGMHGQLRKYTGTGKLDDVLKSNESGKHIFTKNIGEVKLSKNEKNVYVVDSTTGIVIVSAKQFNVMKIVSNARSPKSIALIEAEGMFILHSNGEVSQTIDEGSTFNTIIEGETIEESQRISRKRSKHNRPSKQKRYYSICWDGFTSLYVIYSHELSLNIRKHQLSSM
ncbi:uncharacterized protein LOC132714426 [Ruditapes philippinarum]|uniref:uncharacterized protein LOC132714426 n=1 Tax=Ruditapes philippinarum TaxID=129788 RepID=UPI00295AEE33|nr:uncharacterized protein LOC132714426 [Ruditapes philippinarum]